MTARVMRAKNLKLRMKKDNMRKTSDGLDHAMPEPFPAATTARTENRCLGDPKESKKNFCMKIRIGFIKLSLVAIFAFANAWTARAANASVTVATPVSAISADTASPGGTGAYTALTGPAIVELNGAGMRAGTMILTAPSGFQFDTTANSVTVTVTGTGTGSDAVLAASAITPTTTTITVTISTASTPNTRFSTFTWSGINVRPTGTALPVTGNITYSGSSTDIVLQRPRSLPTGRALK